MSSWSGSSHVDKVALIVKFWEPGASAAYLADAISSHLGEKVTRNAVAGVYHRCRANAKSKEVTNPLAKCPLRPIGSKPDPSKKPRPPKKKRAKAPVKFALPLKPEPIPEPEPDGIPSRHVELRDLGRDDCRWPTKRGTVTWLFCGLPAVDGKSYCEGHQSRAEKARPVDGDCN